LIGVIKDRSTWDAAFLSVSVVMLVAGLIWLLTMPLLVCDLAAAEEFEAAPKGA